MLLWTNPTLDHANEMVEHNIIYTCHNSGHPSSSLVSKYDVSETAFCLRLKAEPIHLDTVGVVSPVSVLRRNLFIWTQ
jgi:hypothetical protein